MNFTHYTLGEALSSSNEIIKRNAFSILKQLQKTKDTLLLDYTQGRITREQYERLLKEML